MIVDAGTTQAVRGVPSNVLIVFDRSDSMTRPWSGEVEKWIAARDAVTEALTASESDLAAVGALLFPRRGGTEIDGCSVDEIDSEGQFEFENASNFLRSWDHYWSQPGVEPSGATPMLRAFEAAERALTSSAERGSPLQGPTVVVVITDGRPNCSGGEKAIVEPLEQLTPFPERWYAHGIRTHVIGLTGDNLTDAGIVVLDGIARAGGTDRQVPAGDRLVLQEKITEVVEQATTSVICMP